MHSLTRWVIYFLARGPYRFLIFLIMGASVIGFGILHAVFYEEKCNSVLLWCWMIFSFSAYFVGMVWYAYLIYRGKWEKFWDLMKWAIDYGNYPE